VDEKQRDSRSELFTGFEHKLTRDEEANWLASRIVQSENGDSVNVVAEVDGRIVANGQIKRGHYSESRHHGELGLTVMGAYRGIGIGREIVKILLGEARRIGLKSVDVEFLSNNKAAVHTYQKAGFIEAGRIPRKVYRKGKFLDSLIMVRRVPRKSS
jgi:ribosomal protein S18 acetylase RimI-like enzyme